MFPRPDPSGLTETTIEPSLQAGGRRFEPGHAPHEKGLLTQPFCFPECRHQVTNRSVGQLEVVIYPRCAASLRDGTACCRTVVHGEQCSIYALIQLLTQAAYTVTRSQRERLVLFGSQPEFILSEALPGIPAKLDLYLLLVEPPTPLRVLIELGPGLAHLSPARTRAWPAHHPLAIAISVGPGRGEKSRVLLGGNSSVAGSTEHL